MGGVLGQELKICEDLGELLGGGGGEKERSIRRKLRREGEKERRRAGEKESRRE